MKSGWLLCIFSSLVLAGLFMLAFRFPGALGGWLEPAMALLFPLLLPVSSYWASQVVPPILGLQGYTFYSCYLPSAQACQNPTVQHMSQAGTKATCTKYAY